MKTSLQFGSFQAIPVSRMQGLPVERQKALAQEMAEQQAQRDDVREASWIILPAVLIRVVDAIFAQRKYLDIPAIFTDVKAELRQMQSTDAPGIQEEQYLVLADDAEGDDLSRSLPHIASRDGLALYVGLKERAALREMDDKGKLFLHLSAHHDQEDRKKRAAGSRFPHLSHHYH